MLTAKKNILFENLFAFYHHNLIRRKFNSYQINGLNTLFKRNKSLPLIIFLNHSSWWDGLIAFEISHNLKLESFIMMDEKQLKKLFLFRLLGAFSINKENPRQARNSLEYAVKILKKNNRHVLWIFPQGEILPNDKRPIYFYNGLSKIVQKFGTKIQMLPIAIRYEFTGNFKPEIFVKIGEIELFSVDNNFSGKKLTEKLSLELTKVLDSLKTEIVTQNFNNFENLI